MKDDERYLLRAAQAAGEFVPVAGVNADRLAFVRRKWTAAGWLDDSGELTLSGLSAKGATVPVSEPEAEPPAVEPDQKEPYNQGTYIGSPLLYDNELEDESIPSEVTTDAVLTSVPS